MYFVYVTGPLGPGAHLTLAKFVTHNYTELWSGTLTINAGDVLYLGVELLALVRVLGLLRLVGEVDRLRIVVAREERLRAAKAGIQILSGAARG